jgi:hypothetical protein
MGTTLTRRLSAAALALGVATATVLVAAAPAQAVPGLVRVSETSATNSSTSKSVTAQCPAGTTVIGGGGHAGNLSGEVFVTGLRPVVSLFGTGYQTIASEDETGYAGNWYVSSFALCAPAPPGLEYRWTTSPVGSQSSRGATATCTAGKRVLGTGAVINDGGRHVGLSHVLPTPAVATQVAAVAHEDETGYGGSWSITSWAVCANPLPGYQRVVGTPTTFPTSATAWCPAGTEIHGAGGYLSGGWGQVRLVGVYPWLLAGGYAVAQADETGYGGSWSPVAVIICAA